MLLQENDGKLVVFFTGVFLKYRYLYLGLVGSQPRPAMLEYVC